MAPGRVHFSKGQKVEVRVDEDGFRGAWFEAVVSRTMTKTRRLAVTYDSILSDAQPSTPLRELISWNDVRPRPPREFPGPQFRLQQGVEAYHKDGWWPGFVSEVVELEAEEGSAHAVRYTVTFPCTGEVVHQFGANELRARLVWDGDKWVSAAAAATEETMPVMTVKGHAEAEVARVHRTSTQEGLQLIEVEDDDEVPLFRLKERMQLNSKMQTGKKPGKPEKVWDRRTRLRRHVKTPPPQKKGPSDTLEQMHFSVDPLPERCNNFLPMITESSMERLEQVQMKRRKRTTYGPHRRKRKRLDLFEFQQQNSEKTKDMRDSEAEVLVETAAIGHVGVESEYDSILGIEDGTSNGPARGLGNQERGGAAIGQDIPVQTGATVKELPVISGGDSEGSQPPDCLLNSGNVISGGQDITIQVDTSLAQAFAVVPDPMQQTPSNRKEGFGVDNNAPHLTFEVNEPDLAVQTGDTITGLPVTNVAGNRTQSQDCLLNKESIISGGKDITVQSQDIIVEDLRKNCIPPEIGNIVLDVSRAGAFGDVPSLEHTLCNSMLPENNDLVICSTTKVQSNSSQSVAEHNDDNDRDLHSAIDVGSKCSQSDDNGQDIRLVTAIIPSKCRPQFSEATRGEIVTSQVPLCSNKEIKLPFLKASPVWKMIESMELYRNLPQQPHFCPLEQHPEDLREGEAIGIMLSFDSLVTNIRKLRNTCDPKDVFEQKLENLLFFESHGFDVGFIKKYLKGVLQVKGYNCNKIAELENQISVREKEIAELSGKTEAIDMTLGKLRKIITTLQETRASTVLLSVKNDSEIAKLREEVDSLRQVCPLADCDFMQTSR